MEWTKALNRFHLDFLETIVGGTVVLYFLYRHASIVNFDFFLKFSLVERTVLFLILAIVLGKASFRIGSFIVGCTRRLLRDGMIKNFFSDWDTIRENLKSGLRQLQPNEKLIVKSEFFKVISGDEELRLQYHHLTATKHFWFSVLGALFISIVTHESLTTLPILLIMFCAAFVFSLSVLNELQKFWHECAESVVRGRSVLSPMVIEQKQK